MKFREAVLKDWQRIVSAYDRREWAWDEALVIAGAIVFLVVTELIAFRPVSG